MNSKLLIHCTLKSKSKTKTHIDYTLKAMILTEFNVRRPVLLTHVNCGTSNLNLVMLKMNQQVAPTGRKVVSIMKLLPR